MGSRTTTHWNFNLAELYSCAPRAHAPPLLAPFTIAKAQAALRNMNKYNAPGPDGIGPSFYQKTWQFTSGRLMSFLEDFYHNRVELDRLNRAYMVLLPK